MGFFRWFVGAVLAVFLACIAAFVIWAWPALYVPPVRDFTVVDLKIVNQSDFRACQTQSMTCLATLPYDQMLRVRLRSDRNLVEYAVAHELNIWSEAWSCSTTPDRYAAGEFIAPGVYIDEERMPYGSRDAAARFYAATGTGPESSLSYDLYLVPRRDQPSNSYEAGKEISPPYDLTDGRDVCLHIGGGNMIGGHFIGNTVRVSAARIKAAMAAG